MSPTAAPIAAWKWGVVWLMFLATMLNYMDRQAVQATSTHLKAEFRLTEKGLGEIDGAFMAAYATAHLVAGVIADRVNLRRLYAGALLVWSAAGLCTGLVETVGALLACRVLLGIGESFNWPCAVNVVRRLIPQEARSLANGIFHSGASVGAALTPLVVLALVGEHGEGWRGVFLVIGAVGAAWAGLWFLAIRGERAAAIDRPPEPDPGRDAGPELPAWRIVTLPRFWLAVAYSSGVNVCWHFFRAWLPRVAKVDFQFSERDMLLLMTGFFMAADVGALGAGWATRRLAQAGLTVERARKVVMLATAGLCLLAIPGVQVATPWLKVTLILVVAAGAMGGFPNYFALTQDVSPRHTALCVGLVGSAGLFLGSALQPLVGEAADASGTFLPSLMAISTLPLIGALIACWWPEPPPQPLSC